MFGPPLRPTKDGVLLSVHVTPNASKDCVSLTEGVLRVKTCAPAVKGKANKAVESLLRSLFGYCEVVSGKTSRKKTVFVRGLDNKAAKEVFEKIRG